MKPAAIEVNITSANCASCYVFNQSRGCSRLRSILADARYDDQKRIEAHWRKVQEKKAQAADLRSQISRLKSEISSLESSRSSAQMEKERCPYRNNTWYVYDSEVDSLNSQLSSVRRRLSSAESDLQKALKAPDPVVQPLPQNDDAALRWLFFLHMDTVAPRLQHLSHMAFAAQQLVLLPCTAAAKASLKVR